MIAFLPAKGGGWAAGRGALTICENTSSGLPFLSLDKSLTVQDRPKRCRGGGSYPLCDAIHGSWKVSEEGKGNPILETRKSWG